MTKPKAFDNGAPINHNSPTHIYGWFYFQPSFNKGEPQETQHGTQHTLTNNETKTLNSLELKLSLKCCMVNT